MKKNLFPFTAILMILTIGMAACAAKTSSGTSSTNSAQSASNTQSLPQAEKLLVGIFKLEGTGNAVTKQEASTLLPLWQAYDQVINSNTAAQAEINAVVSQIQGGLTSDQVKAISSMKLTGQDLFATLGSLGLTASEPNATGTPGASTSNLGAVAVSGGASSAGGLGGPGGAPAGAPPSGGPVGGEGGGFSGGIGDLQLSSTQQATLQAGQSQLGGTNLHMPEALLKALIELLQKRAQS